MFALAGGDRAGGGPEVEYPARTLYENAARTPASVRDIEAGSNGSCLPPKKLDEEDGLETCTPSEEAAICSGHAICLAGLGYDGPSGLGTPNGLGVFQATGRAAKKPQQLDFTSTAPSDARVAGTPYTAAATSSSGLAASFASVTPSVCAVEASTVSFSGVGHVHDRSPAGGRRRISGGDVGAAVLHRRAGQPDDQLHLHGTRLGRGRGEPYSVSALASSGLPVTFSSLTPSVCTPKAPP